MDLNRTFINQLFEESELEKLKGALSRDRHIVRAITKIIEYRRSQLDTRTKLEDFQNFNWPLERAFTDGKAAELSWLLDILTKE